MCHLLLFLWPKTFACPLHLCLISLINPCALLPASTAKPYNAISTIHLSVVLIIWHCLSVAPIPSLGSCHCVHDISLAFINWQYVCALQAYSLHQTTCIIYLNNTSSLKVIIHLLWKWTAIRKTVHTVVILSFFLFSYGGLISIRLMSIPEGSTLSKTKNLTLYVFSIKICEMAGLRELSLASICLWNFVWTWCLWFAWRTCCKTKLLPHTGCSKTLVSSTMNNRQYKTLTYLL